MGKETELKETELYAKIGKLFMELEFIKQRSDKILQEINALNDKRRELKEANDEPQTTKPTTGDKRGAEDKASGKNQGPKQDNSDTKGQD